MINLVDLPLPLPVLALLPMLRVKVKANAQPRHHPLLAHLLGKDQPLPHPTPIAVLDRGSGQTIHSPRDSINDNKLNININNNHLGLMLHIPLWTVVGLDSLLLRLGEVLTILIPRHPSLHHYLYMTLHRSFRLYRPLPM